MNLRNILIIIHFNIWLSNKITAIYEILCIIIFKYLKIYDKHAFKCVDKYTNQLYVCDLYNINKKYPVKLNGKILSNYQYVEKLYVFNNPKITRVNHMTNLREFDVWGSCGIDDEGMKYIKKNEIVW